MNIVRENIENIYSLTPMQEGMLFHSLAEPDSTAYFQQMSYRLEGQLDLAILSTAWQELVRRHEILRTVFVHTGSDRPVQVVLKSLTVNLVHHNLRNLDLAQQESFCSEFKRLDLGRPFDPASGPLMRLAVIDLGSNRWEVIWSHHHILMDGWSMGLLQEDFLQLFESHRKRERPPAWIYPPFKTFISQLAQKDQDSSREFWRRYLAGYNEPANVPTVYHRQPGSPPGKSEFAFSLDSSISAELNQLAGQNQVTLNILLQAIWALLLCKYNGTTEVVFGTVVSGRPPNLKDVDKMVGLFINTIPVRFQIPTGSVLTEVLAQAQKNALDCETHDYLPLSEIQKVSQLRNKLFSTHFSVENFPLAERVAQAGDATSAWKISRAEVKEQTHYLFDIQFIPGTELQIKLSFDNQQYCLEVAKQVEGHLRQVIQSLLRDPLIQFSQIDILTPGERSLLGKSNLPSRKSLPAQNLAALFEVQAVINANAVALSLGGVNLTYADLNARANRVAHYLIANRVAPGSMVAICLDRSMELVIAILAVVKAGGTYVPIDPAYPQERQLYMLSNCGASVLISEKQHAKELQEASGVKLCFIDQGFDSFSVLNPALAIDPLQTAYVLYTSGSTGRPKGVMVSHFNVDRLFRATEQWFHFSNKDCWTFFHSAAFDFSVWEIWGALLYGGKLVIVPYWISRSPQDFWNLLLEEKVTILNQTPSAFLQLMRVDSEALETRLPLRKVIFGGEALDIPRLAPWIEKYGDSEPMLVNMYGITETTVHVTYRPIRTSDVLGAVGSMVGVPIPDLGLFVLDAQGQLSPFGVKGEIYVSGAGLAIGYLNRPELTRERFARNPNLPEAGILYRTGDAARRFIDGELEYLGRTDQQFKIRGFRVEPGEIESVVNTFPHVTDCVVMLQSGKTGGHVLVTYLVTLSGSKVDNSELRIFLESKLPSHMVPNIFVQVEALPLTEHGKIDRSRLASLQIPDSIQTTFIPPRNEIESSLASAFADVLKQQRVGIHDNYFSMGGDSITAIQVLSRLLAYNLKFQLKDLFSHPTIAQLAPLVTASVKSTVSKSNASEAFLAPMQARFLLLHPEHRNHFNHAMLLKPTQRLNALHLGTALRTICSQHPMLGIVLRKVGDHWKQGINVFNFDLVTCDLRLNPEAISEFQRLTQELQHSFDLEKGPLFKATLFQMPDGDRLFLLAHHWIIDAVSWRIFLEDFQLALEQVEKGLEPPVVRQGHSFFDFIAEIHRKLASFQQESSYWQSVIQKSKKGWGITGSLDNAYSLSARESFHLCFQETSQLLNRSLSAYNNNVEELILSAILRAWRVWKNQSALVIHLENHGRDFPGLDLSRAIGWFTNLFPVSFELSGNDLGYHLKQVKESIRTVPNGGLGYGTLRYLSEHPAPFSGPEFASFNYLGRVDAAISEDDFSFANDGTGDDVPPDMQRDFYFEFSAMMVGGDLEVAVLYPINLVTAAELHTFFISVKAELKAIIQHCSSRELGQLTPSDLTYSEISLDELEGIIS